MFFVYLCWYQTFVIFADGVGVRSLSIYVIQPPTSTRHRHLLRHCTIKNIVHHAGNKKQNVHYADKKNKTSLTLTRRKKTGITPTRTRSNVHHADKRKKKSLAPPRIKKKVGHADKKKKNVCLDARP